MNKTLAVVGGLLGVCALFFLGKRSGEELTLPSCEVMEKVETPIHFFTGDFVSDERLQEYVDYANLVLENSCIPMKRTISNITRLDLSSFESHDTGRLHRRLIDTVGETVLQPMQRKGRYYVLILPEGHAFGKGGFVGEAHLNFSRSFFVMTADAQDATLEHELGHLAWAWHNDEPIHWLKGMLLPEFHSSIKPYAFGALCREAGTVMTYAEKSLPVYSSPDIKYFGTACGDADSADNARHMREFAMSLM